MRRTSLFAYPRARRPAYRPRSYRDARHNHVNAVRLRILGPRERGGGQLEVTVGFAHLNSLPVATVPERHALSMSLASVGF